MKTEDKKSESMGYPTLESLLEQPQPDLTGMKARLAQLSDLSKNAKTAKDKAGAKQAMLSYTRFFELFDKLLEVRANLVKEKQSHK